MSDDLIALGPGKVDLLESINTAGSISEAARQGHISYRRALLAMISRPMNFMDKFSPGR